MKSTGEVMSIDRDRGLAYLKSQLASGNRIPGQGNIFVSLKDEYKQKAVPLIRQLVNLGYELYATRGTSTMLYKVGIRPATCSASPVAARTCWTSSTTRKCSGL